MAQGAVISAFKARLATEWNNRCPIVDSLNGAGDADAPFLTMQFPVANEDQISIGAPGANLFRETGAARFVLSIKTGIGIDGYIDWIDALRASFRAKQFNGVNTWAPSSPVLDDDNNDGGFWLLSFAVPYYFDFIS